MPQFCNWEYSTASPARSLRIKAIMQLTSRLPVPYNYTSYLGGRFREIRLERELAEFDLLYRLAHKRPARLDQITCVGCLLIESNGGSIPSKPLPLDEELFVNRHSFAFIVGWMEERLKHEAQPSKHLKGANQ